MIEQLLVTTKKNGETSESEIICECSLGSLKYNSVTDFKYEPTGKCNKQIICHFVAREKHKARISTKHFLRHKEFNDKRKAVQAKNSRNVAEQRSKNPQKNLLDYLS